MNLKARDIENDSLVLLGSFKEVKCTWGFYYQNICNLQEIDKFCSKLASYGWDKHTSWKKHVAYYGICALQTSNVFIVQVPGLL